MAAEIGISGSMYGGSGPLYATAYIYNGNLIALADRQYLIATTGATELYNAADWAAYTFPLTKAQSGDWVGNFPPLAVDADYWIDIYQQNGSAPSITDTDLNASGEFGWYNSVPTLASIMQADALGMMDAAQPLTYNQYDVAGNLTGSFAINGVVSYQAPLVATENGRTLTGEAYINVPNAFPLTSVNCNQDRIVVAPGFGMNPIEMLIVSTLNSNAGLWHLKVR